MEGQYQGCGSQSKRVYQALELLSFGFISMGMVQIEDVLSYNLLPKCKLIVDI